MILKTGPGIAYEAAAELKGERLFLKNISSANSLKGLRKRQSKLFGIEAIFLNDFRSDEIFEISENGLGLENGRLLKPVQEQDGVYEFQVQ